MRRIIIPILALSVLPVYAQLNNTVEVTNKVKPVVKDADKINMFPSMIDTPVSRTEVEYQKDTLPMTEFTADPMTYYSSDEMEKGNKIGYAHLSGGSHGQVDLLGTLQINITDVDKLNVALSLKGHNGKVSDETNYDRMYSDRIIARYDHMSYSAPDFYISGEFGNDRFNYMESPLSGTLFTVKDWTDKQHNQMVKAAIGIDSYSFGDFTLSAEAGMSFFGQKYITSLYEDEDKYRETLFHVNANGKYQFSLEHAAELGIKFFSSQYPMAAVKGVTHVYFTPHYTYSGDNFSVKAGAIIGTNGNFAPDVNFTYHLLPSCDFYVNASGYSRENELRRFSEIHPYFVFEQIHKLYKMEICSEFHTINANIGGRFAGVKIGPDCKLGGDVNVGYDIGKGCPWAETMWVANNLARPAFSLCDTKRFYFNADVTFSYKDIVKFEMKNQLNFWSYRNDGSDGWAKGNYLEPKINVSCIADVKLIKGLHLGLSWEYSRYASPELSYVNDQYKRPNTKDLGASVRYALPISLPLSVFVRGENLLNEKDTRYFGYRNIGANVLGGVAVSF